MTFKKISIFAYATYTCLSFFTTQAIPQPLSPKGNIEKPITVIIPSYNNKYLYKKNLDSVFTQNYQNYKIIYINDASTDGTGELVQQYIKDSGQEHRTTLINNPKNLGAMANHYTAVHMCDDNEIIVHLDGDDFLKHTNVLQIINKVYQNPNIWLTYGQYEELHYSKEHNKFFTRKGHCKQIPKSIMRARAYREYDFVSSHLRTFYAGVFKQIKLKDFILNGKFYDVSCDIAFMMPMLELAHERFKLIEEVLYIYNCISPLNDFKRKVLRQLHIEYVVRAKEKYKPLETPFRKVQKQKGDIIIVAEHSPAKLHALLNSIQSYISGIENIYVLSQDKKYLTITKDFPKITFITGKLKETLEDLLEQQKNKYILLAQDNTIVTNFVDLQKCIENMEQTKAYGFYLSLGKNTVLNKDLATQQTVPVHTKLQNNTYFWQFKMGEYEWRKPHDLNMVLYRKDDILQSIKKLNYNSCQELIKNWNLQDFDLHDIGLFFKESKALSQE